MGFMEYVLGEYTWDHCDFKDIVITFLCLVEDTIFIQKIGFLGFQFSISQQCLELGAVRVCVLEFH